MKLFIYKMKPNNITMKPLNNRDMKYSKLFSKREKCYMYGNHVFVSNIRKKHSFIIETFEDYCKKCWEHKERLRLVPYHSDEI